MSRKTTGLVLLMLVIVVRVLQTDLPPFLTVSFVVSFLLAADHSHHGSNNPQIIGSVKNFRHPVLSTRSNQQVTRVVWAFAFPPSDWLMCAGKCVTHVLSPTLAFSTIQIFIYVCVTVYHLPSDL